MKHCFNIKIINNIIKAQQFDELLNYTNFDLSLIKNYWQLIKYANENIVYHIVTNTDNIHYINEYGDLLIHECCRRNSGIKIIQYLIDKKIDLNHKNNFGWTPLHIACQFQSYSVINLLIDQNINIELHNNLNLQPIHIACVYRTYDIVKLFINRQKNISKLNNIIWSIDNHNLFTNDEKNRVKVFFMIMNRLNSKNKYISKFIIYDIIRNFLFKNLKN